MFSLKTLTTALSVLKNPIVPIKPVTNLQPKLLDLIKPFGVRHSHGHDPSKFISYNDKIYPPQLPGEEPRPAYVCHQKVNIKYSQKKMYYIACFVRGMSVDEAIKQLKQVPRKGAFVIIDALKEAQEMAVREHNVEFKSNLWVAESFATKGVVIKGIRRHARGRMGEIRYKYCHYFVRLEEGKPPKQYYWSRPEDGPSLLQMFVEKLRKRKIINSL